MTEGAPGSHPDLRVLLYGEFNGGVSESIRFGAFAPYLPGLGVEMRTWASMAPYEVRVPSALTRDVDRAVHERRATIDLSPLAWADVVVFRRWYGTAHACLDCDTVARRAEQLWLHLRATGHRAAGHDIHARVLFDTLADSRGALQGAAVLYDTDDDLLGEPGPPGLTARLGAERRDVRSLLALADLVTASTPVLAERLAPYARAEVRVVRNALDPAWYEGIPPDVAAAADPGALRIVYHGPASRMRDYAVARAAVDETAAAVPGVRRVWLGAGGDPAAGAAVDEARPWVDGAREFAASLAAARPGIGLAPLADDRYNRARSELHWLEYALAGAPSVLAGFDGPGPYDPVRDGVDGLVARGPDGWRRQLAALAASPALRADLAGAARDRVLAGYTAAARAPEWAQAYRDAAMRAVGAGQRT